LDDYDEVILMRKTEMHSEWLRAMATCVDPTVNPRDKEAPKKRRRSSHSSGSTAAPGSGTENHDMPEEPVFADDVAADVADGGSGHDWKNGHRAMYEKTFGWYHSDLTKNPMWPELRENCWFRNRPSRDQDVLMYHYLKLKLVKRTGHEDKSNAPFYFVDTCAPL
jgi:hypothetical protein